MDRELLNQRTCKGESGSLRGEVGAWRAAHQRCMNSRLPETTSTDYRKGFNCKLKD